MLQTPLPLVISPPHVPLESQEFLLARGHGEFRMNEEMPCSRIQATLPEYRLFPCSTYVNTDNICLFKQLRRKCKRQVRKLIKRQFQNTSDMKGIIHLKMRLNKNSSPLKETSIPLNRQICLHKVLKKMSLTEIKETF